MVKNSEKDEVEKKNPNPTSKTGRVGKYSPRRNNNTAKDSTNEKRSNTDQREKRKCYRCNRLGYLAKDCYSKTKLDGSKCEERSDKKTVNSVNTVDERSSDSSKPSSSGETKSKVLTFSHMCSFNSTQLKNVENVVKTVQRPKKGEINLATGGGTLLEEKIECNGVVLKGFNRHRRLRIFN